MADSDKWAKISEPDSSSLFDDTRAMDLIAEYMSEHEWSADTLDEIAGVVIATGREIKDPFDAS